MTDTDEARAKALLDTIRDRMRDFIAGDDDGSAAIVALIRAIRAETYEAVAARARNLADVLDTDARSTGEHDMSGAHLRDLADWCEGQEPRQ
jgi:hypothetical protein